MPYGILDNTIELFHNKSIIYHVHQFFFPSKQQCSNSTHQWWVVSQKMSKSGAANSTHKKSFSVQTSRSSSEALLFSFGRHFRWRLKKCFALILVQTLQFLRLHMLTFQQVARNFCREGDQGGWNKCDSWAATSLSQLFQCRNAVVHYFL